MKLPAYAKFNMSLKCPIYDFVTLNKCFKLQIFLSQQVSR